MLKGGDRFSIVIVVKSYWYLEATLALFMLNYQDSTVFITLILRRSRTGTVWFYTSTSNKRAA